MRSDDPTRGFQITSATYFFSFSRIVRDALCVSWPRPATSACGCPTDQPAFPNSIIQEVWRSALFKSFRVIKARHLYLQIPFRFEPSSRRQTWSKKFSQFHINLSSARAGLIDQLRDGSVLDGASRYSFRPSYQPSRDKDALVPSLSYPSCSDQVRAEQAGCAVYSRVGHRRDQTESVLASR